MRGLAAGPTPRLTNLVAPLSGRSRDRASARKKALESIAAPAAQSRAVAAAAGFGSACPRALAGAESALDGGEARRAIARSRGERRRRRDSAAADPL